MIDDEMRKQYVIDKTTESLKEIIHEDIEKQSKEKRILLSYKMQIVQTVVTIISAIIATVALLRK